MNPKKNRAAPANASDTAAHDRAVGAGRQDILHVGSPGGLGRIHDPAVELVVWERSMPDVFERWLDALSPGELPDGRVHATLADLPSALTALLETSGVPADPERDFLRSDVLFLATAFMTIMASDTVDVRLETIRHDACWKFHRDRVEARLLTTYRGPGTQCVTPDLSGAALARQEAYRGPLCEMPRHAAGLFKGSRADAETGIVHRSPPVAHSGATRLLLCLNLPFAASPRLWKPQ